MKQLSQEIFSNNHQFVEVFKKELIKEGTAKFWNDFIGDESYLLSNNTRLQLQSEISFNLINNFLSNPNDEHTKSKLINFMQSTGISTQERIDFINEPDINSPILKNKNYFDEVNKNLLTGKSAYYLISNLSNYMSRSINLLSEKVLKLFGKISDTKTNITDPNYLTQPSEMMARYFESQVFNKKSNIINAFSVVSGVVCYKINKDSNFEDNKNKILTSVFGKDKILANMHQMRLDSIPQTSNLNQLNL